MMNLQYERADSMLYITNNNLIAIIDCSERIAMGYIKLIVYNTDTCKDELIIDYDGDVNNKWEWPEIKMVWDIVKRYFRAYDRMMIE